MSKTRVLFLLSAALLTAARLCHVGILWAEEALPLAEPVQAVLRLRLRAATPHTFQQIAMDRLSLFLAAGDEVALKLYELVVGSGLGVLVGPPARPLPWFEWLGREAIQPVGFAREQGYRRLELGTVASLTRAVKLYERYGFRKCGVDRHLTLYELIL